MYSCRATLLSASCAFAAFTCPPVLFAGEENGTVDAPSATVSINAARVPGPVNPLVFGHGNLEAADTRRIHGGATRTRLLRTGDGVWDERAARPSPDFMSHARDSGVKALRYPGGCLVHNFDWRKTVGPREQRGDWQFGLDDFLAICRELDAEPIITVSDYVLPAEEMPRHAAELVEYLNAPATPAYPWAMKRAGWGHPEPYGVRYFELGNESDHGNHAVQPRRQFTPATYARYAIDCAAAMRAIDPSVRIGIVTVPGPGDNPRSAWNREVVRVAGAAADFVILHFYAPALNRDLPVQPADMLMRACMAVGDQIGHRIQEYKAMIRDECGRDLPVAITEFNAGFVQPAGGSDPTPWRLSYGAALQCADLYRVFLKPENTVLMSSYWQFYNGYWGMLQVREQPDGSVLKERRPAYELIRLWGQHFGETLVDVTVAGPRADFDVAGWRGVAEARGIEYRPRRTLRTVPLAGLLKSVSGPGYSSRISPDGSVIVFDLKDFSGEAHPVMATIPLATLGTAEDVGYRLTYECQYHRTPGSGKRAERLGLTLADTRDEFSDTSRRTIPGAESRGAWSPLQGELVPRTDSEGIDLRVSLVSDAGGSADNPDGAAPHRLNGKLQFRLLELEVVTREIAPATELVTASSSLSADGRKLYVVVFNKSPDQSIATTFDIRGFVPAGTARYWEVNGPSLASVTGVREVVSGAELTLQGATLLHTLPAHSMTAIELDAR
ncbi:alpha-L-arabinofuranosidase [Opitutaceae bacterium TAV5]|nr:alpha-L-arabinofuranosidase [Opitutaceae bacterium TAV5]